MCRTPEFTLINVTCSIPQKVYIFQTSCPPMHGFSDVNIRNKRNPSSYKPKHISTIHRHHIPHPPLQCQQQRDPRPSGPSSSSNSHLQPSWDLESHGLRFLSSSSSIAKAASVTDYTLLVPKRPRSILRRLWLGRRRKYHRLACMESEYGTWCRGADVSMAM
jgi:hypothetical protein